DRTPIRLRYRLTAEGNEFGTAFVDLCDLTEIVDHIRYRRTNDGAPGGHIFKRFRGVDVCRGLVQCEGHETNVEFFAKGRQIGVRSLAKPVQVRAARQSLLIYFHDRPYHDQGPIWF